MIINTIGLLHLSFIVIMNSLHPASFEKFLLQVLGLTSFISTLCMIDGYFFLFYCCLLNFKKKYLLKKKSFRNTIKVSNGLDPDQAGHSVGPDLCPNCLQKLNADDTK